ncbi:MAG: nicotinate phosphoribosyltransferase [Planctomycetia bacterium]|nr:nicotinate phosphoribosyltransferase [Planctomycetia bacterium]
MMIPDISTSGLLTDLYQFTMVQGYLEYDLHEPAVFEFFVRKLPQQRNFLIAAGLELFLDFLEQVRFSQTEIEWLARQGFGTKLLDYLSGFRFTGDVHAMPEGTIFFPDEPILRVTAPLPQAQLMETRAINLLHFQSVIASKSVRMVLAAPGKQLVDFGLRRAHGAEAGLLAARACYLVGFAGTATALASQRWGVPVFGTMAHSFVEAHDEELAAFEHFAVANPKDVTLILDSYDTEAAAHKTVSLAKQMAQQGIHIRGVRLDSGDLGAHARRVRLILDEGGLGHVRIVASGGLDEYRLAELVCSQAPIDGFGIGSRLDVSSDAPFLDCAYKLEEYAGKPRRKCSEDKATWPGRKQVLRHDGPDGQMARDLITLEDEPLDDGEPLVVQVMRQGRRIGSALALEQIRVRVAGQLEKLPVQWKGLDPAPAYPVEIAQPLRSLAERLDRERRASGN